MILLANGVLDGTADQETLGGIDMTVRRNAFGRQVHSFEGDLAFDGFDSPVHAVFIRAPWVERLGDGVEALATIPSGEAVGRIVAVRAGHLMATSFHPEVGADDRVHRYFVELVKQS
jgi:5'-phosphate synthase pdxT subunit